MKSNMFRLGLLLAIIAVLVVACAPAATPTAVSPTTSTAGEATAVPTAVTSGEATTAPTTAASGEATVAPTTASSGSSTGVFRVAVVYPSQITDAAFSQSMQEALLSIQQELGKDKMEIAYSENMFNVPDAAAAIRDYATQGYNLVIAHGSQYGTSLAQIAPDFPKTSFAWGTSLDTFKEQGINNVFAYQAEAEQGAYVLGTVGALMSKSGTLGIIGPVEAGDAKLYVDGFKQGAEAANKNAKVQVSYTGSFSDVSLMAAAAETNIQAGADVLTGSSQSVVGAIGVAKDKGVYWFGTQWDQTSLAPDAVVASQVYDWVPTVKDMMANIQAGTLGDKSYNLTLENGGLKIVYNDKITVPDAAKTAAEQAIKGIEDGSITVAP